ncbi:MAG: hypothetical protein ACHREM_20165 [Polyangiales bacterium]
MSASEISGSCAKDADCTSGINGRCLVPLPAGLRCSYDDCFVDDDCSGVPGSVCACREGGGNGPNTCTLGTCRIDADCGSGGYCSPSPTPCTSGYGVAGYFCKTAGDSCQTNTDCVVGLHASESLCAFDATVGMWTCVQNGCPG